VDPAKEKGSRLRVRHALAGLEAGVLGALVILACLMIGSLWDRRSVWVTPNLFATTFYGIDAYRNQLLRTSWAGAALLIAIYGVLGIVWGCIWRDRRRPWMVLYGAIAGIATYYIFFDFIWKHANPLFVLYAPNLQLQIGHLFWGMILAQSPKFARRIAERIEESHAAAAAPVEVKSGELIL
jgi:hypothetical protein